MYDSLSPLHTTVSSAWRGRTQCACDEVIALVARRKNVPIRLLTHKSRSRLPVARARQLAMYLSHIVLGRSLLEIAEAFGRDRTTVSYACAVIEDMRDDPRFDEEVTALEQQIEAGMAGAEARHHG
ncbi:MAG: chromosomal replication initiator DnaA [Devosia ginsengisoli]|nr:helix-turn-helix domain-containing protein [Devosia ginsengisoli]MCR6673363.1 chromosomal replication initiator DnaA [Devosia ginsengisoli]